MVKLLYINDNTADIQFLESVLHQCNAEIKKKIELAKCKLHPMPEPRFSYYELLPAETLAMGLGLLGKENVDVILLVLTLPDSQGLKTFEKIFHQSSNIPIIILSDSNDAANAADAVEKGARDWLLKEQINGQLLIRMINWAIEKQKMITQLEAARQTEHHLVFYDNLTNLPNRQLFYDFLRRAITQSKRHKTQLAVLYLNLDSFKRVNDSLGHTVGDELLKILAGRLRKIMRESDTVSRLGGDEFTVILEEIRKVRDAVRVAQKILKTLSQPVELNPDRLIMTTSIGISIYPEDGTDVQTLVKNADIAMCRAKAQCKDNYQLYNRSMNASGYQYLKLENDLRSAINNRELMVHYQPQVQLDSGMIIGVEALLRWNHPKLGLVPPSKFIPVAEESGIIIQIGEWILRTACRQNKKWQEKGYPPIRVSINISAKQFQHKKLTKTVAEILHETKLSPRYLGLEITETNAMHDVEHTIEMLGVLKQMGIQISVDDFGTGYSSLSYLKRFPLDMLKIDQSFMRDIATDSDDAAITSTIIALAHSLELRVIAEGVETEEQLKFLRSRQCDEIQGFHFSRPLPADNFLQLFHKDFRKAN